MIIYPHRTESIHLRNADCTRISAYASISVKPHAEPNYRFWTSSIVPIEQTEPLLVLIDGLLYHAFYGGEHALFDYRHHPRCPLDVPAPWNECNLQLHKREPSRSVAYRKTLLA